MRDLELMLRETSDAIAWPSTPDLATSLDLRPGQARRPRRAFASRRGLALALGLLFVSATTAYATIPSFRDAVRDFLGIESVEIDRAPRLPPAIERPLVAGLGERMSLARAREAVDFEPRVPASSQAPQVYAAARPAGGRVSFVYPRAAGKPLLVTQFRGKVPQVLIQKVIGPGTRAERLTIDGAPALWLSGRPHVFLFEGADGEIREERIRLAGDTLIWVTRGLVVRIEGAASRAEALRIARALP